MNQEAVYLGSVLTLELCFFDPAELDLREEGVVLFVKQRSPRFSAAKTSKGGPACSPAQ